MIDLTSKVSALATALPSMQIAQPASMPAVSFDSAAMLKSVLSPLFSGRVYPCKLPDNPVYPSLCYELDGCNTDEVDDYPVTRGDVYLISVQASSMAQMIDAVEAVENALNAYAPAAAAGGIEILNKAFRWDDALKRYEYAMQINVVSLALPTQTAPAVMLYALNDDATDNTSQYHINQIVTQHFAAVLMMQVPGGGFSGVVEALDLLRSQIIGTRVNNSASLAELVESKKVGKVGGLTLWRDVYHVKTTLNKTGNWS